LDIPAFWIELFVIALSLGVHSGMPRAKMATPKRNQFGGKAHAVGRKFECVLVR